MSTNIEFTQDLENWMGKMPQQLKKRSIIHLAIPGSHDSMTFSITAKSKIAPDAEPIIQCLKFLGPLTRVVVSRWGRTQDFNVLDQLNAGIRYFDLRVATKKGTEVLYFVHGLYAGEVKSELEKILNFLNDHPDEVVILDCQHFYAFEGKDHENLMHLLNSIFQNKLVPYSEDMTKLSLEYLTQKNNLQVIAVYREDAAREGQPLLWPAYSFPTPWPNTDDINKLLHKLNDSIALRSSDRGFISQCILTPSSDFVMKHLFSTLKAKCAVPLQKEQYTWLTLQVPGPKGVNIVINDFVDMKASQFSQEVIALNEKLLM